MKLRPYQEEISTKAKDIVQKYGIVLLSLEVRTGKTIISLETIKKL
jgi:superfamily II DNA or RNA helicase